MEDFLAKGSIPVFPDTLVNGVGTILDVSVIEVPLPADIHATLVGSPTGDSDSDVGVTGRDTGDLVDDVVSINSPLALRRFHTFRIHHPAEV